MRLKCLFCLGRVYGVGWSGLAMIMCALCTLWQIVQVRYETMPLPWTGVSRYLAQVCAGGAPDKHKMISHLKICKFLNLLSHLYISVVNKTVAKYFPFCQRKVFHIFLWFFNACLHK